MTNIIGRFTINPFLFITGKISGYACWLILLLYLLGFLKNQTNIVVQFFVYFVLCSGLLLVIISVFNLGNSTSLGLPTEKTLLKTHGLYRFSRNPMYVGFDLLTLSSILFIQNVWILSIGLYSIFVYHFIILGEEKFLIDRFGHSYSEYCKKVRRYI
jgi:protein-S-isoprenylcysteine O-methyltransferase Ste14